MDKTFELVICIDEKGKRKVVLEKGTIDKIDNLTTSFENSDEIRSCFPNEMENFEEKYKIYMESLALKNNRKEQGDIALIGTINKEPRRIKVLYKKDIIVFREYIIKFEPFQQLLKAKGYYEEYCEIQRLKYGRIEFNEQISFLVRKILKLYTQYAKENGYLSIDTIYKHIQKEKALMKAYEKEFTENEYEEQDGEPPISYEVMEQEEKEYYASLNFPIIKETKEIKGRQKVKKISGGI